MEVKKVSPEALQKAIETLGLNKAADAAAPVVQATTETVVTETPEQIELKKAEEAVKLAQAKVEELKKPKTEAAAPIEKAVNTEEIVKALSTAFDGKFSAVATLIQSKDEQIGELNKAVESLNEFNQNLAKKIGMIERTPLDRKSVTGVGAVDRFKDNGGNNLPIEKSMKTISLSNKAQRKELVEEVFKAATKDGKIDAELSKAVTHIELGQVLPELRKRLITDFNINVVK